MSEIEKVIAERGARYGDPVKQFKVAQAIKEILREAHGGSAHPVVQEMAEQIATKLSRIFCGDPLYRDNVVDIEGYARIVADFLKEMEAMDKKEVRVEVAPVDSAKTTITTPPNPLPGFPSSLKGVKS